MAATEKYVSASGGTPAGVDDPGSGSAGSPYATMQYALNQNTSGGDGYIFYLQGTNTLGAALDLTTFGPPTSGAELTFAQWPGKVQGELNGAGSYSIYSSATQDFIHFHGLTLTNCGSNTIVTMDDQCSITNCTLSGSSNANAILIGNTCIFMGNAVSSCTGSYGLYVSIGYGTVVTHNWFYEAGTSQVIRWYQHTSAIATNNIFTITTAGCYGIYFASAGYDSPQFMNNSILHTNSGTAAGIYVVTGGVDLSLIANNIIEGYIGTGGAGIEVVSSTSVMTGYNYVSNCTDSYLYDSGNHVIDLGDDETGASAFAKSGGNTFANRFTYFAPNDVGNVLIGGYPSGSNRSKGAVQYGGLSIPNTRRNIMIGR